MVEIFDTGAYLLNGHDIVAADVDYNQVLQSTYGNETSKEEAAKGTMAYRILESHNTSGNMEQLKIKFDKLTSHDITFVGIIQTARASGMDKFPIPYVLTNCHNSLCAVGGTINEDDHMYGLTCAKKYGGVYVPPHQAVIHQYAREQMAGVGKMILGSDSHTRYGALGTMAMGEGGPELVKQLLSLTYDIVMPGVIGVYLSGNPAKGVGPQDVALAIIGAVFENGYVNNKIMEFVGPGIENLSADFRMGIDVMTTETTCLSSIWKTDHVIEEFYEIHGRQSEYKEIKPEDTVYYDGLIRVNLDQIKPMIAMPFHPSNTYTIEELNANLTDILRDCEQKAKVSLGENIAFRLTDKVKAGKLHVQQGIIAGCAGGGFENICAAAQVMKGSGIGSDEFSLSVYPASTPIYLELVKNGMVADLMCAGAVVKTAFCGPCFGAGDTPAHQAFSIRHSTRNFPNREGSKLQNGQISSVALMDARSIAATAANKGCLTAATDMDINYQNKKYYFDQTIYENRVYDSHGKAEPSVQIQFGPNIKDWPAMPSLPENLILKITAEIHDPVTTTDELIPSGETSSYRSNPEGLAEYTLSRKDPGYTGRAKAVREIQRWIQDGKNPEQLSEEFRKVMEIIRTQCPETGMDNIGVGSVLYAVKPGDGSAREQAASCQKVLGGWANIASEYATKRYRSNLINWGMLPLLYKEKEIPFHIGDYLFLHGIRKAVREGKCEINAYRIDQNKEKLEEIKFSLGNLTAEERNILGQGCLINARQAELTKI